MNKPISNSFLFAGGTVIGADHVMVGKPGAKNNQDYYTWVHGRNCSFAVVCDGCSSGERSEIGATIGAKLLSTIVVEYADRMLDQNPDANLGSAEFWRRIEIDLLTNIRLITKMMGNSVSATVNSFWLFTIVGVLITPTFTYVVNVGDGFYAINGNQKWLKPGEGNAPTYLAYQISGTTLALSDPSALSLKVCDVVLTDDIECLGLGTDGVEDIVRNENNALPGKAELVGPLEQFWTNPSFFANPDAIRRRLALMSLETAHGNMVRSGLLKDDVTIVVIKKNNPPTSSDEESNS